MIQLMVLPSPITLVVAPTRPLTEAWAAYPSAVRESRNASMLTGRLLALTRSIRPKDPPCRSVPGVVAGRSLRVTKDGKTANARPLSDVAVAENGGA